MAKHKAKLQIGVRLSTIIILLVLAGCAGERLSDDTVTESGIEVVSTADLGDVYYLEIPPDENWYDRIFENCKKYGLRRVYWRVSVGRAFYRSNIMTRVSSKDSTDKRIVKIAKLLEADGPEPLELAVKYAHKHGIELYAWFPFNEQAYSRVSNLIDLWYAERKDLFWRNCDGSRVWMGMPCIAESQVVQRTVSIIEELCGYGVDGVYLSHRSHCYFPEDGVKRPLRENEFGFNEPIRNRFLQRYGVDICKEEFDVDAWQRIKGEFYTEFLAACAEAAHQHGAKLEATTATTRSDYIVYLEKYGNNHTLQTYNNWEAWVKQAKVDAIVVVQERVALPSSADIIPHEKVVETTHDVREIIKAVGDCPVRVFHPILAYRPRGGGSWSHKDRILESLDILDWRIKEAQKQGISTFILQEGYVPMFLYTEGKDNGIGPCPKMEYWQAVKKWNSNFN